MFKIMFKESFKKQNTSFVLMATSRTMWLTLFLFTLVFLMEIQAKGELVISS